MPQAGIRLTTGSAGNIIRYNTITGTTYTNPISGDPQIGIQVLANWMKYYCLDALAYGDQLRADNNIIVRNTISKVVVGVYMGDEKAYREKEKYCKEY